MVNLCANYNVILSHSTPYNPQGNKLEESSNKSLVRIIKKMIVENRRGWYSKLGYALWVD